MFKLKKIMSIIMITALTMSTNIVSTYATATPAEISESLPDVKEEADKFDLMLGNVDTSIPGAVVELPNAGDSQTISIQIDHSLYPKAVLFGYIHGNNLGTCTVKVTNESGANVSSFILNTASSGYISIPKAVAYINSKEGQLKNYTVTVSTTTGNAGCTLNLGTESDFVEKFGGSNNIATVAKNQGNGYGSSSFMGSLVLLNGEGEWFRYTADGDTFIRASAQMEENLECTVYDADTMEVFASTNKSKDFEKMIQSSTIYTGYLQKLFKLESGHEYLIQIRSTSKVTAKVGDAYAISVGLPSTYTNTVNFTSSSSYSIPANVSKTFFIQVNWPKSDRLSENSYVKFSTPKSADNVYITSCEIVAPNGKILRGTYGEAKYEGPVDFSDFLNNTSNVPINGTWKVTIKASKSLSNLQLKMIANAYHVPGDFNK